MKSFGQLGEFVRFAIAGSIGFCVDVSVLLFLVDSLDVPPLLAKVASFSVALPTTWLINRSWTFRRRLDMPTKLSLKEFGAYLAVQLTGASMNYATFAVVLLTSGLTGDVVLVVATAAGVLAGMSLNFAGNKWVVFRRTGSSGSAPTSSPPPPQRPGQPGRR
jgi:putative flippase GtrA